MTGGGNDSARSQDSIQIQTRFRPDSGPECSGCLSVPYLFSLNVENQDGFYSVLPYSGHNIEQNHLPDPVAPGITLR